MTLSSFPFLSIGVTSASFSALGTVSVVSDKFMMYVTGSAIISALSLKNLAGNLSGSVFFFFFFFFF